MYLQRLHTPSRTIAYVFRRRVSVLRLRTAYFSHLAPRHQEHTSPIQRPADTPKDRHGRPDKPYRGSIRPFTVLFLCIPLGYGVNWLLKTQNSHAGPDGFVRYILLSKEDVSPTCSIFTLKARSEHSAIDLSAPGLERAITSVQFKQPQLQIARSYTLLPQIDGQDPTQLRFLIRKEHNGEVSGYLHRLRLDAELEVRGISREYVLLDEVGEVLFLAGGTGIAPAMQVANILRGSDVDLHVLWANRKREDCVGGVSDTKVERRAAWWDVLGLWSSKEPIPCEGQGITQRKHQIVQEMDLFKAVTTDSRQNLRVDYFVDEENTFIEPRSIASLLQGPSERRRLVIVSGPEGFINYCAGPKRWLDGRETQGPLGGVLGGLNTEGWDVVKL